MQGTLETYLRNGLTYAGVAEFALLARIEEDGRVTFCLHPQDANGETADFEVSGNTLAQNRDITITAG